MNRRARGTLLVALAGVSLLGLAGYTHVWGRAGAGWQPVLSYHLRDACKLIVLFDQVAGTTLDDDCPGMAQAGDNSVDLDIGPGCVYSADVPGTFGPDPGGDVRQSCIFDGTNESIYTYDDAAQDFHFAGGLTACSWFRPDGTLMTRDTIVARDPSWTFFYDPVSQQIRFIAGGVREASDDILVSGAWNHVCVTWAGEIVQDVTFYIDGIDAGCAAAVAPCEQPGVAAGPGTLEVGGSAGVNGMSGNLHEVQVYEGALNEAQIAWLYRCGSFDTNVDPGSPPELPAGQQCRY